MERLYLFRHTLGSTLALQADLMVKEIKGAKIFADIKADGIQGL